MKKQFVHLIAFLLFLFASAAANAAQFSIVGTRALGMGGAGVAVTDDSTAVYWNPAALARTRRVDIRIPGEVALRDHMGLKKTWNDVIDLGNLALAGDPLVLNRASELLTRLTAPNTGADLDGSVGLFAAIPLPETPLVLGVSALGLGYVGMYPTGDAFNLAPDFFAADSVIFNRSAVTGVGIGTIQPAVTLAAGVGGGVFIGANAKMLYGQTYANSEYLLEAGSWNTFFDNLDKSKQRSSEASVDAGILFAPVEGFSIGVVGRDLTSPSFPVQGNFAYATQNPASPVQILTQERNIELKPQVRAGVAWKPYSTLTLAADYDLTKNKTLVPGFEDQTLSVGLEQTLADEYLSLRVGAYRNLAESGAKTVYTAGLGTRIAAFRLDLAGAYDFDKREYQASLDLALRF